ncbi:MAG: phospholipase D-like domain-containing protein, partial [Pseudomonadota bacterium]
VREVRTHPASPESADIVPRLRTGTLPFSWVPARLVIDDPHKARGRLPRNQLMFSRLSELVGSPGARLDIVSAYFVPGPRMVAELAELEQRGVEIRVFTNSLEATDVAPVHAGYAKYRIRLLRAGVELFELRPGSAAADRRADLGIAGSSSTSLHAKVFAVDGNVLYVGSFNFDPRSMFLNTEMGLVIESTELAQRLHAAFTDNARGAYRPLLRDGALIWQERRDGRVITHAREPGTTFLQRLTVRIIGRLPVHWLL